MKILTKYTIAGIMAFTLLIGVLYAEQVPAPKPMPLTAPILTLHKPPIHK